MAVSSMNTKRNSSLLNPIIDLKAELFRKQEELKKQKIQSNNASFVKAKPTEKKPTIWSKQNAGVLQRAQKDLDKTVEEEDQNEKSRKALERKTKLYEQIATGKGIPEEDGSKVFLVDFQKKAIDNIREQRDRQREEERGEDDIGSNVDIPPPKDEGEEWVDYTDSLGRSRRCMKKDLPELKTRDKQLQNLHNKTKDTNDLDMPTLLSDDMRREMLRQKWEKEELEAMNGPIHYSNVRFDEIRSHGVGFFDFDKTETGRQEQLDTLNQLRKQTVDERSRKERLKEKRKAMLDARLAKVKQRKMLREGGSLGPDVHLKDEEEPESDVVGPKLEEMTTTQDKPSQPELLTRDDTARQNKPTREWDKGKEKMFPPTSGEKYFEERRNERIPEFAPPSNLYTERCNERNPEFAPPSNSYMENTTKYHSQPSKHQTPAQSRFLGHGDSQQIKHQSLAQSRLLGQGAEIPVSIVSTHNKQNYKVEKSILKDNISAPTQQHSKEETSILKDDISAQTQPSDSVLNKPLPPNNKFDELKSTNSGNNGSISMDPPLFDFSIPPPNVLSAPATQTPVPHFYPYPESIPQQSGHMYYSANPIGQQTDHNITVGIHHSQETQAVIGQNTSHVTPESYHGQQSVLTPDNNSVIHTDPPKQKLNIIDPRFIQNKDVLSENPGNMAVSGEKEQLFENENSQIDSESLTKDKKEESGKQSCYHSETSFYGKPVVYK